MNKRIAALSVVSMLALAAGAASTCSAQVTATGSVVEAYTEPSQHLKLSFYSTGVIRQELIKEGQAVKAGQGLLQEDERVEEKRLESMYPEAYSQLKIKASEAEYQMKKSKYERLAKQHTDENAASTSEVEEAKADADVAQANIGLAKDELKQKKAEYEAQKIRVELMQLKSPVDAIVETIETHLGEVVDPTKSSVTVAVNDPLWIRLPLPTDQAQRVNVGEYLQVSYDSKNWYPAKVIVRSPVASAASTTQDLRLELPNQLHRDSGLKILVKLTDKIAGTNEAASAK